MFGLLSPLYDIRLQSGAIHHGAEITSHGQVKLGKILIWIERGDIHQKHVYTQTPPHMARTNLLQTYGRETGEPENSVVRMPPAVYTSYSGKNFRSYRKEHEEGSQIKNYTQTKVWQSNN